MLSLPLGYRGGLSGGVLFVATRYWPPLPEFSRPPELDEAIPSSRPGALNGGTATAVTVGLTSLDVNLPM